MENYENVGPRDNAPHDSEVNGDTSNQPPATNDN